MIILFARQHGGVGRGNVLDIGIGRLSDCGHLCALVGSLEVWACFAFLRRRYTWNQARRKHYETINPQ